MSIVQGLTTSFKLQAWQAGQNLATDTLKIALYTSSAALDYTTTAYSPTNEVVATGYAAGGQVLTGQVLASSGQTVYLTFNNPVWSAALTARCALIYNTTRANASVAVLDFGSDKTSSTLFTISMPGNTATTALIRAT